MARLLIPLGLFVAIAALLFVGLGLDPDEVPSALIDKPAPAFELPTVSDPTRTINNTDLAREVSLFNVWASWCVACREEHPLLLQLANAKLVPIYGLNYKDKRDDATRWLDQLGDPYVASAYDLKGTVGIDWGVYGVPETFVVDADGIIRYKHIGPVTAKDLETKILPLVKWLQDEQS